MFDLACRTQIPGDFFAESLAAESFLLDWGWQNHFAAESFLATCVALPMSRHRNLTILPPDNVAVILLIRSPQV